MAEYLAVVWFDEKTTKSNTLAVQRLQFEGVTLERYRTEEACASYVASQIHTFLVCKTDSGSSLLIARVAANTMQDAASVILDTCKGEVALQVTEVLRSGTKKEVAVVGYHKDGGVSVLKEISVDASSILTPPLGVPVVIADPEKLNVSGIMASIAATIGTTMIAEAMKPGANVDGTLDKGASLLKEAIPKIQQAIEVGIPLAKGAGDVIANSIESLADHGKVAAAQFISKIFKTGAAGVGAAATVSTAARMSQITALTIIPNSTVPLLTAGGATAAAGGMLTIPYAGWIMAGLTLAAVGTVCICCAISKAIPIPRRIETDIKKVGEALTNFSNNPYPSMVYQLAYASGPDWKKQFEAVSANKTAFIDSTISAVDEAVAIIVRTKATEAWEDSFPGWMMLNTQSMILEMSNGERVPLGIVSSSQEFLDFIHARIPPLANPRYKGLLDKFIKQSS